LYYAEFSPDGTRVVTTSADKTIRIWDAATGEPLATLHGHAGAAYVATYTADGTGLVSVGWDGTMRTWDVRRAESGRTLLGHTSYVYSVAFHPDGRRAASARVGRHGPAVGHGNRPGTAGV